MNRLRVGVVGLGAIAQTAHLPLLRRRWDLAELTAVADLSPARLAQVGAMYGVPPEARFGSLTGLLGSGLVDAVVLATTGSHGPAVLAAIEAGVPVLCEKPLAFTVAEAAAVVEAERRAGRPMVLVGYMKEYDPATARVGEALRGLAAAGRLAVRAVEVEVLHPADGAQLAFAGLLPPADDVDRAELARLSAATTATVDAALGAEAPAELRTLYTAVVLGSVIHDLSLLRHLLGGVESIDGALHWPAGVLPGSVELRGTVAGGARLHLAWHYLDDYPVYRETVTVHHATGSAHLVFPVPYLLNAPTEALIVSGADGTELRTVGRDPAEAFERELVAFHAMATAGAAPSSGPVQAMADIVAAQAAIGAIAAADGVVLGGEAVRPETTGPLPRRR